MNRRTDILKPSLLTDYTERIMYATGSHPRYDGTASAHVATAGGRYDYLFDCHDRLIKAAYSAADGISALGGDVDYTENFSAEYTYNPVGVPLTVKRYGVQRIDNSSGTPVESFGVLDNLSYTYDGMLLSSVLASGSANGMDFYGRTGFPLSYEGGIANYEWNAAGLLNKDSAREITGISYNWNGQPTKIDFTDKGYMSYTYTAAGTLTGVATYAVLGGKRATKVSERRYCGDFVFEGDSLLYANFGGGYFDGEGQPHYRHADFQGNITMVTDGRGQVEQHTGYYPYGEPWREPAGQPYLYGGKERMRDHALNEYDFGARRLSSALCLWTTSDPKAIKYARLSPYAYCGSNPIRYIDPTGCDTVAVNEDGTFNVLTPTDDPFDVLVGRNGATKQVEKGFIEPAHSSQHTTTDSDGEEQELETSIYNGASATKETFEFLAQNTSVEWSIFYGQDEILIGTSHSKNKDISPGVICIYFRDFLQGIQRFDHSHTVESHASPADVGVAAQFESINPNIELNVFYTPTGEYLRYTQDRVEMKEVVVEAPAPDKLPFMAPLPVASRPVFQFKLR